MLEVVFYHKACASNGVFYDSPIFTVRMPDRLTDAQALQEARDEFRDHYLKTAIEMGVARKIRRTVHV